MKTKEVVLKIREQVYVDDEPFHLSDDEAEQLIQDYSDQQNKEMWEYNMGVTEHRDNLVKEIHRLHDLRTKEHTEKDAEIQRLKERNKYLEEHSNERFEQANELNDQDETIQRLTKEVDILKNDLMDALDLKNGNGPTALTMLSNENTRLRELLRRAKRYVLFFEPINELQEQDKSNLLTDIKQRIKP